MKGLLEMLAKSGGAKSSTDSTADVDTGADEAEPVDDSGFNESASQMMGAIKSGDDAGFADALRACIEMSR